MEAIVSPYKEKVWGHVEEGIISVSSLLNLLLIGLDSISSPEQRSLLILCNVKCICDSTVTEAGSMWRIRGPHDAQRPALKG